MVLWGTALLALLPALLAAGQASLQGSGVVLVRISSILNPEGRDAAGACCSEGGQAREDQNRGGKCSAPCYTMLRVCASRVANSSQLLAHHGGRGQALGDRSSQQPALGQGGRGQGPVDRNSQKPPQTGARRKPAGRPEVVVGRPLEERYTAGRPNIEERYPPSRPVQEERYPPGRPLQEERYPPGRPLQEERYPLGRPPQEERFPPSRTPQEERFPPGKTPQDERYSPGRPNIEDRYPPGRPLQDERYPPGRSPLEERYPPGRPPLVPRPPEHPSQPAHRRPYKQKKRKTTQKTPPHSYFPTIGVGLKPPKPRLPKPPPYRRQEQVAREREQTFWDPEEFTVMWREERALLKPDTQCTFGSLNTEVIFNNSLEQQGDLLIRLPFSEAWPGVFELTIEAWHINKPRKIPQPRPAKPGKRNQEEKSIFASILETLSDTLSRTVENIEKEKLKEVEDKIVSESEESTTLPNVVSEDEQTTEISETSTRYIGGGRRKEEVLEDVTTEKQQLVQEKLEERSNKKEPDQEEEEEEEEFIDYSTEGDWVKLSPYGKLVLRTEQEHVTYAGEEWQAGQYLTYHSRIDYTFKLACAKNYTGPTCSIAKVCLGKVGPQDSRLSCTAQGQVLCQPGWQGPLCKSPVCAPGCHSSQGFCRQPGECRCKTGYTGPRCEDCVKLLGCVHGTCTKAYQCLCEVGYRGLFCSQPICGEGCSPKHGHCSKPGECRCREGWQGEDCRQCVPREGCREGYCEKPGECTCKEGFRGLLCDRPECGGGCHPDNGFCETAGQCFCRPGYQGPQCNQCVPYPGCLNGECGAPWTCDCRDGWQGIKCDQLETDVFGADVREGRCLPAGDFLCMNGGSDVCSYWGNGTAMGVPRCECAPGFSGEFCQETENAPALLLPPPDSKGRKGEGLEEKEDAFPQKLDNSLEKLR